MPNENTDRVYRAKAGVRRGKGKTKSIPSTKPHTHVRVAEGFQNVISANDRAIRISHNR